MVAEFTDPEINDVFFTILRHTELRIHFMAIKCILSSVGRAVCGKTSKYSKYFDEFATTFKIKYWAP